MNMTNKQKKQPNRIAQVCVSCVVLAIFTAGITNMCFCLKEKQMEQSRNEAECASTEYVRERAESGDCIYQCELGLRLLRGDRAKEDGDQGFLWLLTSAEQGYKPARDGVFNNWHYYGDGASLWERDPVVKCRIERLNKFKSGDDGSNGRFVRFVRKTNPLIQRQSNAINRGQNTASPADLDERSRNDDNQRQDSEDLCS